MHVNATLCAFADACTYIHATLPERITNVIRMQAMLYYDVRGRFGLSSNLAQQAFRRVAANRKAAKASGEAVKAFDPTSIQYDQRIFTFRERDWTVSLTLLHGRAHFRLSLGNYQRGKLRGQRPTSAQLCKHTDGSYAIHIQIKTPIPPATTPTDVLGVDLGRTDIAHTSEAMPGTGTARANVVTTMPTCGRSFNAQPRRAPEVRGGVAVHCWHGCRGGNDGSSATRTM